MGEGFAIVVPVFAGRVQLLDIHTLYNDA